MINNNSIIFYIINNPSSPSITEIKSSSRPTHIHTISAFEAASPGVLLDSPSNSLTHFSELMMFDYKQ